MVLGISDKFGIELDDELFQILTFMKVKLDLCYNPLHEMQTRQ